MSQAQAKRQHTWDVLEGAHTFYLAIGLRRYDDGQFEAFRGDALNVVDEGDMRGQGGLQIRRSFVTNVEEQGCRLLVYESKNGRVERGRRS